MGFDWAEKFSEGRKIRQRVPVLGYRVPLLSNLQVKIKGFSVAVKNVTNRNILCGNVPTVLVSIVYQGQKTISGLRVKYCFYVFLLST